MDHFHERNREKLQINLYGLAFYNPTFGGTRYGMNIFSCYICYLLKDSKIEKKGEKG